MKSVSIRVPGRLFERLKQELLTSSPDESVAFLVAHCFETSEKLVFLAHKVVPARPKDYLSRGEYHLEVSPLYVSRVLNIAEESADTVIMAHSHPFEMKRPKYSMTDDFGEARTAQTISRCLDGAPPVGSLLLGRKDVTARAWLGASGKSAPAEISTFDERAYYFHRSDLDAPSTDRSFLDRQIRALGTATQAVLDRLEIGIVGLGGTGSSVAEQLVRMGATKLRLVDHDVFERSNWSRLYGSTWDDGAKKKPKVEVVSSHLQRINPQVRCQTIGRSVMRDEVLRLLSNCDIVFSCLDRHAPRAVLNELCYQCYVPLLDVGVGLTRNAAGVVGGAVRATLVGPGLPCLLCQEIVRPELITAENLTPEEYERRRVEGYIGPLNPLAPSVISYTTLASSLGLILFIDLISGRGQAAFSTLLFDLETKEITKIRGTTRTDCACQKRIGRGFSVPFSVAD